MIALLVGLIVDMMIGDPEHWTHPVRWIGKLIQTLEKSLYRFRQKRFTGGVLVFLLMGIVSLVILSVNLLLEKLSIGWLSILFHSYAFFAGIAFGSLIRIIDKVIRPFRQGKMDIARKELSYYVSRETKELSEEQILKTIIETLSENTVDGIIAPVFYGFIGELFFGQGILFIWIYKSINTMDSMIGYKNSRYSDFGFCAAKLDDVINFLPARIGSLLLLVAGGLCGYNMLRGFKIMLRDHAKTASPNAGYPESAIAGLLGIQIGGTYTYFGKPIQKETLGEAIEAIHINHVYMTKKIIWMTQLCIVLIVILGVMEKIL